MVRTIIDRMYDKELHYCEFSGKSTDTKPVGKLVTGSMFTEIDTRIVKLYDEEAEAGKEWAPFAQFPAPEE